MSPTEPARSEQSVRAQCWDRAKYLTLVLVLCAAGIARLFGRAFLDVTVHLAPAIVLCLIGVVAHGLRHDLDS